MLIIAHLMLHTISFSVQCILALLAFVSALEEDIVHALAASKNLLFIKGDKSKMSLLIHLMPHSSNHHSKLIRLYYVYDLLMDFHYLCLLFLIYIFYS